MKHTLRLRFNSTMAIVFLITLTLFASINGQAQVETEYPLCLRDAFCGISSDIPSGAFSVNTTNMELAYDMETLDSGDINDFSANDYDGTLVGTTDSLGQFGRARNFDDDYITVPNVDLIGTETNFTIALWVRFNDVASFNSIYGEFYTAGTRYRNRLYVDAGLIQFDNYQPSGGPTENGGPVINGIWYHIAYVQEGTNWWVYVNGTVSTSGSGTEIYTSPQPTDTWIGAKSSAGGPTNYLNASIDEFEIYTRPLGPDELAILGGGGTKYTFIFEEENIVPTNITTGATWLRGSYTGGNQTWGAKNYSFNPLVFTTNVSVWEGQAISWDSYSNISTADIGFNFTISTGAYPYWINDTFQANLTTIAGEIDFNWTDWLDGEHLFELGMVITSTPILTGLENQIYQYDANITKTNVIWTLEQGPSWLNINEDNGLLFGTGQLGVYVITIRATKDGIIREQDFTIVIETVPVIGALTNVEWIEIILISIVFLFFTALGFSKKDLWPLLFIAGLIGVVSGIWLITLLESGLIGLIFIAPALIILAFGALGLMED